VRSLRPLVPRLRLYEALVLADVVALILLIHFRARVAFDVPKTLWGLHDFGILTSVLLIVGLALRLVLAAVRGGATRARHFLAAAFRPTTLLDLARFVVFMVLTSYVYAWLKVMVPLLNGTLWDEGLARLETAMHFGINPGPLLLALYPSPALWRALDSYYAYFFPSIMIGVGWFATTLSLRERARFAAGFSLLWIAGSWGYLAAPSLGPCYAFPDDYAEFRRHATVQARTQDAFRSHYGAVRMLREKPGTTHVNPVYGIGAMPSLHVAGQAFLALWARRRCRPLFLVYLFFTLLTFFGSLVTGWHYAVDCYAGVLLAMLCVAVGERVARERRPPGQDA
jgi:hypothetical protein